MSESRRSHIVKVSVNQLHSLFIRQTESPRYDTLTALEQVFNEQLEVREPGGLYKARKNGEYTIDDYRALPDEQRVELIDGYFYDMASPTFGHQSIGGEIHSRLLIILWNLVETAVHL